MLARLQQRSWVRFDSDPALLIWLKKVHPLALATAQDPALRHDWLRNNGTWFVGVNALANDKDGSIAGSGPMPGPAMDFIRQDLGLDDIKLDRAQVSICYPGYPQRDKGDSDSAFQFRLTRDAAHVDGLHPVGPDRRRKLLEFQGFLIGIPVTKTDENASPMVVWEGSHQIMRAMFRKTLVGIDQTDWPMVDLTDAYQTARRAAFETCRRVVVHAHPGQAYLLHPMALHGVAPWQKGARAEESQRAILYFRPDIDRAAWLTTA